MTLNRLESLSEGRQLLLLFTGRGHGLEVKVSVGASQHGAFGELESYFFVVVIGVWVVDVAVVVIVVAEVVVVEVVGLDVGGLDP